MSEHALLNLGTSRVRLIKGDITQIAVDAIVNAANSALAGGGGVDGAIHRAGGPRLMQELDEIRSRTGHCPTGGAVVTSAGDLPARYVFHAVGPIYRDGKHKESELLASCYDTCLELARENAVTTISFPSISTGVYRYPPVEAAAVALETVTSWLSDNPVSVREVILVQFSEQDHSIYLKTAQRLQSPES